MFERFVETSTFVQGFAIAGIWKGMVLTIGYSSGEIKVWDLATLQERRLLRTGS
jgi:hypothetical protein